MSPTMDDEESADAAKYVSELQMRLNHVMTAAVQHQENLGKQYSK